MAKKATRAIPTSTISIVPITGEFRNRLPKTSQNVNTAKKNKTIQAPIAE